MPDWESPTSPIQARLAFAQVERVGAGQLPTDLQQEARDALRAGTQVERHNRLWRMGQVREERGVLYGRIGFEAAGSLTEVWNEAKKDFEDAVFPSGVTSPFGLRLDDLVIVFQLRGNTIRRQSFAGALQALMRIASGSRWLVEPIQRRVPFSDWQASVERIVEMRFRLERPNPHYGGRDMVESIIEDTGSEMADMVLRASEDSLDGLNIDSDFVTQAVEHALLYGDLKATGERQIDGVTDRVRWRKDSGELEERVVGADPETHEVRREDLRRELTGGAPGAEADQQDGADT